MNHDPGKRPSAEMALQKWREIKSGLSTSTALWRLRKPDESVGERVVLDTIAVAKQGIRSITHLFNDDVRTILYQIDTRIKFPIVAADLVATSLDDLHGWLKRWLKNDRNILSSIPMGLASLPIHLSSSLSYKNCFHAVHRFRQQQLKNNEPDLDGYL